MALPTQKRTRKGRKNRAVYARMKKTTLATCSECEKPVLPHRACLSCGHYGGKKVSKDA